jgi:3-dehydroquinate synthase
MIVPVGLGDRAYEVHVAATVGGLGSAAAALGDGRRCVVVTDENVAPLWLAPVRAELEAAGWTVGELVVPAGEAAKHRDTWWAIVDGLLRIGVDRRTVVVALGGGVVGDLVGFAASAALRGLPFIQVPTTLLAMVDSSVGGKTGFNHALGKNLIGAFYQPSLVWAPLACLRTLPPRELRAGLGEVVKHALIDGEGALATLERLAPALAEGDPEALRTVVAHSVALKARIVEADEREAGDREVLNLGHTVGHAVEACGGYGTWLHGEAVAMGLAAELAATTRAGLTTPGLSERVSRLIAAMGLPVDLPRLPRGEMVRLMGLDKKARGAMVMVPVCRAPGSVERVPWPHDRLGELLS